MLIFNNIKLKEGIIMNNFISIPLPLFITMMIFIVISTIYTFHLAAKLDKMIEQRDSIFKYRK